MPVLKITRRLGQAYNVHRHLSLSLSLLRLKNVPLLLDEVTA